MVDKLANNPYLNCTLAYGLDLETKLNALTNVQLMAAMKKYIVPSKMSVVKAEDFEGAAKQIK